MGTPLDDVELKTHLEVLNSKVLSFAVNLHQRKKKIVNSYNPIVERRTEVIDLEISVITRCWTHTLIFSSVIIANLREVQPLVLCLIQLINSRPVINMSAVPNASAPEPLTRVQICKWNLSVIEFIYRFRELSKARGANKKDL